MDSIEKRKELKQKWRLAANHNTIPQFLQKVIDTEQLKKKLAPRIRN